MSRTKIAIEAKDFSTEELRAIVSASGPCVTIQLLLESLPTGQNRTRDRVKKAIREAEEQLRSRSISDERIEGLLDGLQEIADDLELRRDRRNLVILRSPEVALYFLMSGSMPDCVRTGEHFYVEPLVRQQREENRTFFMLTLSQKLIRLVRSNGREFVEVDLPASLPRNLEDFMQTKPPDHRLSGRSTAGPSTGSMNGVSFTTLADREAKGAYLSNFFRAIDRGVREALNHGGAPLLLAGVDYEVSLYRKVNTYPHLAENDLIGAPGEPDAEFHTRASEVIQSSFDAPVNALLSEFANLSGTPRTSTSTKEIVTALSDGRVSHLFVAECTDQPGLFDEETYKVRAHRQAEPGDEDLVNLAAVQALLTSSEIFYLPRNKMPHGAQLAALFRF